MAHRIREAMRTGGLMPPMGSGGGVVEIDETTMGRKASAPAEVHNMMAAGLPQYRISLAYQPLVGVIIGF